MFFSLKNKPKYLATQTFTYYVPAPPARKSGYQEKEFDHVTKHIIDQGWELIDLKLQAHSSSAAGAGMWIVCIVATNNKSLADKKIQVDFADIANGKLEQESLPIDPDIVHEI